MLYKAPLPYIPDTAPYFAAIAGLPWAAWLDSAGLGRYDILCAQPAVTLLTHGGETRIDGASSVRRSDGNPFELLRQHLGPPVAPVPDIPFAGGALGYWGYDLARRVADLPAQLQCAESLPDMAIGIYDWAVVVDHQKKSAFLVSQQRFPETAAMLPGIFDRLQTARDLPADNFRVHGRIASSFTTRQYEAAFHAVQAYLREGDCYQVNLAQRFCAAASGDALGAYLALRKRNPAPYSAFLDFPQAQVLCASPERFLRVQNGAVETRPIKGTRPRSGDAQVDARLAEELRTHPKDRAENLMIVDLLRNDLGKNCLPGSVRVPGLFEVESYASVHHLVSTVQGRLAEGRDALHILEDCFPGGSVTGAPKLRAMQIIGKLEPHRRGIYCGAIGYAGFDGGMDSNIVIRSLLYSGGEVQCWAGSGIVADSTSATEYQETLDKARAMLELLRQHGGEWAEGLS